MSRVTSTCGKSALGESTETTKSEKSVHFENDQYRFFPLIAFERACLVPVYSEEDCAAMKREIFALKAHEIKVYPSSEHSTTKPVGSRCEAIGKD
jgi:hypothetical protein